MRRADRSLRPRTPDASRAHAISRATQVVLTALILTAPAPAVASPREFIPVGDPIESELRLLDVLGPAG